MKPGTTVCPVRSTSAGRGGAPAPTATTCSPLISIQPGSSTASPVATAAPPSSVVGCGPLIWALTTSRSPTSRRRVPDHLHILHGESLLGYLEDHAARPERRRLIRLVDGKSTPRTEALDAMPVAEMLAVINDEDRTVADAVRIALPDITRAVEIIAAALRGGGRLIYLGAGSSGRIGLLDAVECPPTFGTDPAMVVGVLANGPGAFVNAPSRTSRTSRTTHIWRRMTCGISCWKRGRGGR